MDRWIDLLWKQQMAAEISVRGSAHVQVIRPLSPAPQYYIKYQNVKS